MGWLLSFLSGVGEENESPPNKQCSILMISGRHWGEPSQSQRKNQLVLLHSVKHCVIEPIGFYYTVFHEPIGRSSDSGTRIWTSANRVVKHSVIEPNGLVFSLWLSQKVRHWLGASANLRNVKVMFLIGVRAWYFTWWSLLRWSRRAVVIETKECLGEQAVKTVTIWKMKDVEAHIEQWWSCCKPSWHPAADFLLKS